MKARLFRRLLATLTVAWTVYNIFLATTTSTRRHQHPQQQQQQQHQLLLLLQQQDHSTREKLQDPAFLHLQQQLHGTTYRINNTTSSAIRLLQSSMNSTSSNNNDDDRTVCLSSSCLLQQGRRLARAFPNRPKEDWCIPSSSSRQQQQRRIRGSNSMLHGHWQGLLLVKVPKAASSTSAGVVLRIANQSHSCDTTAVQWQHLEGIFYANRTQATSFLVAPIRQPAARAFSSTWFFLLAPLNITDSDENVIRALNTRRGGGKTKGKGGYQFNYLSLEQIPSKSFWSPSRPTHVMNASLVHEKVQALLHGYDFIMVVERMDESLTALALLTGLRLGDVLTPNSAKVSGDYRLQRIGRKKGQCHYQRKGTMSGGVQRYFNSQEWLAMNYADEILYRAANASLDLTIEWLGRDRFDVALAEYRRLQKKVTDHCGQRLGSGCTKDGQVIETQQEECYDRDFGCGYRCVDDFLIQERKLMNHHAEIALGVRI